MRTVVISLFILEGFVLTEEKAGKINNVYTTQKKRCTGRQSKLTRTYPYVFVLQLAMVCDHFNWQATRQTLIGGIIKI